MKNLVHLDIDYFKTYSDIIEDKTERDILLRKEIHEKVKERYDEYQNNFDKTRFIAISDSPFEYKHPQLMSCYKSKTLKVLELLSSIRNVQSIVGKSKCQYCGIGKPKTIDHYLPISLFPEYAVLAINLMPCCNDCNNKKDNYWKEDTYRGIINFYIDNIPDKQFLKGKIVYRNNLPAFDLEFDWTDIDEEFSKIASAHYSRLELFMRYEEESAGEISEISRQLKIYSAGKKKSEIKTILENDAEDLKQSFGLNYWKAVLRTSLANSDRFLNGFELVN